MKRFIPILCFVFLFSCEKQEQKPVDYFSLSEQTVQAGSLAGTYSVTLSTDQPWRLVNSADWCKVLPESGNAAPEPGDKLYVIVQENTGLDSRSCEVTIEAGERQLQLEIVQAHRAGVRLKQKSCTIDASAQQYTFEVWSSGDFVAEVDESDRDWLSVVDTKAMQLTGIVLSVTENPSYTRRGHITLKGPDGNERIEVVQSGTIIRFDDPAFEQYCMEWDTDHDGTLSLEEARKVEEIKITGSVHSVAGLEYFTQIKALECDVTLDVLDLNALKELLSLRIWGRVKDLRVDQAEQLFSVYIANLQDETLNISDKKNLYWVYIDNYSLYRSPLRSIRINNCPALNSVRLSDLSSLEEVELVGNAKLSVFDSDYCPFSHLSLDRCPELARVSISESHLTSLDVSQFSKLSELDCYYSNIYLKTVYLSKTHHQSLDLSLDKGVEVVYL